MKMMNLLKNERGMEMIQVAILIAIAIGIGMFFRTEIGKFISDVFSDLVGSDFSI